MSKLAFVGLTIGLTVTVIVKVYFVGKLIGDIIMLNTICIV